MQDKNTNEQFSENINTPAPPQQQPGPFYPGAQPVYYPVYTHPKVPGKGLGITSLVLGIIGIVYSGWLVMMASLAALYSYMSHSSIGIYESLRKIMINLFDSDSVENLFAFIFTSAVFTVLACVFAVVSFKKGYRNKISKSGLILSMVSILLLAVFVVFIGYVIPDFWASGMNAMQ